MKFDCGEISGANGDFSRVFELVTPNGESNAFWDSLFWSYVNHNSDVCDFFVVGDSIWMDKICSVCAFDFVLFVALSNLAEFIIHLIVPSWVYLRVDN